MYRICYHRVLAGSIEPSCLGQIAVSEGEREAEYNSSNKGQGESDEEGDSVNG
jgi:hypothetical protein